MLREKTFSFATCLIRRLFWLFEVTNELFFEFYHSERFVNMHNIKNHLERDATAINYHIKIQTSFEITSRTIMCVVCVASGTAAKVNKLSRRGCCLKTQFHLPAPHISRNCNVLPAVKLDKRFFAQNIWPNCLTRNKTINDAIRP